MPKTCFKKERSSKISLEGTIIKSFAAASLSKLAFSKILVSKFTKIACLPEFTVVKSLARIFVKGCLFLAKTSWLNSSTKAHAPLPSTALFWPFAKKPA